MLQHSFEGDERFLKMNTQRCILLFAVFLNKCDFKHWVIIKHSQHNKILFWNVKFLFSHWPCTDSAIIIILQTLNQGPVHIVLFCSKMCTFLCVLLLCPHFNCLGIWDYMNRGSATMVLLTFEPVDSLPSSFGSCWKLTKSFFTGLPKPKRLNNVCKYSQTPVIWTLRGHIKCPY